MGARGPAARQVLLAALSATLASLAISCKDEGPAGDPATVVRADAAWPLMRLSGQQLGQTAFVFEDVRVPNMELPPDPYLGGFSSALPLRNVTPGWVDAYVTAAEIQASLFAQSALARCGPDAGCVRGRVKLLAAAAFRRQLSADEAARVLAPLGSGAPTVDDVAGAVAMLLLMPQVAYRLETGARVGEVVADRLALMLWNSGPDDELAREAARGGLSVMAGVELQARRMVDDGRFDMPLMTFVFEWLGIARLSSLPRDHSTYPEYNDGTFSAMDEQAQRFVLGVLRERPTLRELLTRRSYPVSGGLRPVFGPEADGDWHLLDARDERAGLLGLPLFLTARARAKDPSPIQRGVTVLDRLLCRPAHEVPAAAPPFDEAVMGRTNRERTAAQTEKGVCLGCHESINGVGYAFEAFDSIGRHRTDDAGFPVDDSWRLFGADLTAEGRGLGSLVAALADSPAVGDCFVRQWAQSQLGAPPDARHEAAMAAARAAFAASGGNLRDVAYAFAVESMRPAVEAK